MSILDQVTKGKVRKPLRFIVYGLPGVGKTYFASKAPSPIFMGTEDGTNQLDVARLPTLDDFNEVCDAIKELGNADHPYESLVVDSLDWLEPLIHADVCRAKNVSAISDIPYGGGYSEADNRWRRFFSGLEWLQRKKGMNVLMIAHSKIRTKREPNGDEYDTFTMKMSERSNALAMEWCDDVLFAHWDVQTKVDRMTKKKTVTNGARILHTDCSPGIIAKTRHGLPQRITMDFDAFMKLIDKAYE